MDKLTKLALLTVFATAAGCGGGGGGGDGGTPPPPPPPPPTPTTVVVSGTISFDSVPHTTASALDFNAISQKPARGIVVEAVTSAGAVLTSTTTDDTGAYALSVDSGMQMFVRAKAEMTDASGTTTVIDNTNSDALYVLDGATADTGSADSTRDLVATSGWGGSGYTGVRAAAPFAILDAVYDARETVLTVDPSAQLSALQINWSPNNVASGNGTAADLAAGLISTSFYSGNAIYLLGAENSDTDEYDRHVVAHEWGHYLQDYSSRDDSIGGQHTTADILDPRVAFSEGFGYAWAGIALGDPVTRDSFGNQQSLGFAIDVEANAYTNPGWYSEGSNQSIIYDLVDATDDGADTLTLGWGPVYDVLTSDVASTDVFTSIFTFATALKAVAPGNAAEIDALLAGQSIVADTVDDLGSTETNDAGLAETLPVYTVLTPGAGLSVEVCSNLPVDASTSAFNKLGPRRFVVFDVATAGNYNISAAGPNGSDPDFLVHRGGFVAIAQEVVNGLETLSSTLEVGRYVLSVYEFSNTTSNSPRGRTCFDVSVEPA